MEQVKKEGIKREKKTTYKLLQEVFGKGNYISCYKKFLVKVIIQKMYIVNLYVP